MISGILAFNQSIFLEITTSFKFFYFGVGMFFAYGISLLLGYFLPANSKKERWTNALLFWATNPVLFLVISSQFFSAEIFIGAFFAEIFWIVYQVLFSWGHKKWY